MTLRRCGWRALLLLACCVPPLLRAEALEAIPLQYRLAEDVIPILQPLLPAGAALTGAGDVLLIRADAATVRQVRAALATIDRAPRQLRISVGQSAGDSARRAGVAASGTIDAGDVEIGIGRPPGRTSGAEVVVEGQQARDDIRNTSSVSTLEGREAFVAMGEWRPHRDVQSGFFATPRLNGDRVTLEISATRQRPGSGAHSRGVDTAEVVTTLSGRLGEWIELGGIEQTDAGTSTGIVTWGSRSELTQYSAWVKVEEIR